MSNKMTYEQAYRDLEMIVAQLEKGDKTLDESLELFEKGTKLSAFCYEKLENARLKVTEITKGQSED